VSKLKDASLNKSLSNTLSQSILKSVGI